MHHDKIQRAIVGLQTTVVKMQRDLTISWIGGFFDRPSTTTTEDDDDNVHVLNVKSDCSASWGHPRLSYCERVAGELGGRGGYHARSKRWAVHLRKLANPSLHSSKFLTTPLIRLCWGRIAPGKDYAHLLLDVWFLYFGILDAREDVSITTGTRERGCTQV